MSEMGFLYYTVSEVLVRCLTMSFPLKTYNHPHIRVIIDNRKKETICIIFETDVEKKEDARMLLQNFLEGNTLWFALNVLLLLNQNDLM